MKIEDLMEEKANKEPEDKKPESEELEDVFVIGFGKEGNLWTK